MGQEFFVPARTLIGVKLLKATVVAIPKDFGDIIDNSRSADPGKSLSKPNTRPNSK